MTHHIVIKSWDLDDFILSHTSKKLVLIYWDGDPIYDTEGAGLEVKLGHTTVVGIDSYLVTVGD